MMKRARSIPSGFATLAIVTLFMAGCPRRAPDLKLAEFCGGALAGALPESRASVSQASRGIIVRLEETRIVSAGYLDILLMDQRNALVRRTHGDQPYGIHVRRDGALLIFREEGFSGLRLERAIVGIRTSEGGGAVLTLSGVEPGCVSVHPASGVVSPVEVLDEGVNDTGLSP